jgi:hypothetical protein
MRIPIWVLNLANDLGQRPCAVILCAAQTKQSGAKMLLHCFMGVNRSATVGIDGGAVIPPHPTILTGESYLLP